MRRKKKKSSKTPTKKATKKAVKASKDLRKAVTIKNIMDHLQVFQNFADDSNGVRAVETRGFDLSQQYIAHWFQSHRAGCQLIFV